MGAIVSLQRKVLAMGKTQLPRPLGVKCQTQKQSSNEFTSALFLLLSPGGGRWRRSNLSPQNLSLVLSKYISPAQHNPKRGGEKSLGNQNVVYLVSMETGGGISCSHSFTICPLSYLVHTIPPYLPRLRFSYLGTFHTKQTFSPFLLSASCMVSQRFKHRATYYAADKMSSTPYRKILLVRCLHFSLLDSNIFHH